MRKKSKMQLLDFSYSLRFVVHLEILVLLVWRSGCKAAACNYARHAGFLTSGGCLWLSKLRETGEKADEHLHLLITCKIYFSIICDDLCFSCYSVMMWQEREMGHQILHFHACTKFVFLILLIGRLIRIIFYSLRHDKKFHAYLNRPPWFISAPNLP